jgi:hypothetical protein
MNGGKPLAIDLFCGLGGWAEGFLQEGYRVIGFDNDPRFAKVYPGEFVLADVRTLDGKRFRDARVIVASPPCTKYAPWAMPPTWHTRETPDSSCVDAVWRIRQVAGVPTVLENVRGAVRWLGKPVARRGASVSLGRRAAHPERVVRRKRKVAAESVSDAYRPPRQDTPPARPRRRKGVLVSEDWWCWECHGLGGWPGDGINDSLDWYDCPCCETNDHGFDASAPPCVPP